MTANAAAAPPRRRRRELLTAALCLTMAVATIYLAVPRGVAGWTLFSAELRLAALRRGYVLEAKAMDRLVQAYDAAAAWTGSSDILLDLAFARLLQRRVAGRDQTTADPQLAEIARSLTDGLARGPIHADSWRWLAVIRLARDNDRPRALAATRMSMFTGPYVQFLIVPRIALCLQLWDIYPAEERTIVYQQMRYAWVWNSADALMAMAVKAENLWPFRIALAQNPRDLAEFERRLAELQKKGGSR